jgi:AraC family transcriptional regulator of adaptative response / DNA-3-methyladenine glycosylase II
VALASGFGSVRRFNAAFAERYRLQPSALRREASAGDSAPAPEDALTLRLAWRPPYDIAGVLRYFGQRALQGVEAVDGLALRRSIAIGQGGQALAGWFEARFVPERHEVHLRLAPSLAPVAGHVAQRVRQGLDLDADPSLIDPVLAAGLGLPPIPGIRVPNGFDGFEIAARVVLGQQVTVAAARTLVQRLVDRFGAPVESPWGPQVVRCFPSAATLAAADPEVIGKLGIVRQRVRALQALAVAVHEGGLQLHRGAPLAATLERLQSLPGIGPWTVQLIALRALAWPDAFPASDIGVLNALGSRDVAAAEAASQAWRPWRAYAVMRLWRTLETGT